MSESQPITAAWETIGQEFKPVDEIHQIQIGNAKLRVYRDSPNRKFSAYGGVDAYCLIVHEDHFDADSAKRAALIRLRDEVAKSLAELDAMIGGAA